MPRADGDHRATRTPEAASRASQTLDDLDRITRRTRTAATTALTGGPLAIWGAAWVAGFVVLDLQAWTVAVPVGLALALVAAGCTWLVRSREVRSGRQAKTGRSWLVVMASSPLLVAVAGPVGGRAIVLFLGALWGVSLMLFAVATGDPALGVVGALVLLTGAVCRVVGPDHPLLVFGLVGGGGMLALGVWRMRRAR